ncbi:hypothetical protein HAX54_025331 [Datura stramonium]|uniref:Uncharacterized protein n=1 Tax=Datura stramonium TaxID=4076 RepID=A0ABS8V1F6_DATST|nr:hypothetical protein [Datura stramonium]
MKRCISSHNAGGSVSGGGQKHFAQAIYVDDDDAVFVEHANKAKSVEGNNGVNLQDGLATQGGVEMSHAVTVDSSNRGVASLDEFLSSLPILNAVDGDKAGLPSEGLIFPLPDHCKTKLNCNLNSYYAKRLVLSSADDRVWSYDEMDIVEVVADHVTVVLSHATALEESQTMKEKLEMSCVLQAKENTMKAS